MESITQDLLHCKICIRVLYEPFINPCGHTYCYSCLSQWFDNNSEGRRVTCPECRNIVEHAPAPNYLIRQLVHKLIGQPSFSEEGETPASHERAQEEEARIVERDRSSTEGLFKGRFRPRLPRAPLFRIRDVEDGVERCPHCTWEIEDHSETCYHCGASFGDDLTDDTGHSEALGEDLGFDSAMDEDDEHYLDEDDAEFDVAVQLGINDALSQRVRPGGPMFVSARSIPPPPINVDEMYHDYSDSEDTEGFSDEEMELGFDDGEGEENDDDEEEDGDDDDHDDDDDDDESSLAGFIDRDGSSPSSEPASSSAAPDSEAGDDGESDETESARPLQRTAEPIQQYAEGKRRRRHHIVVIESSEEESSEDEGGPVRARRRRPGNASQAVS